MAPNSSVIVTIIFMINMYEFQAYHDSSKLAGTPYPTSSLPTVDDDHDLAGMICINENNDNENGIYNPVTNLIHDMTN